jgi:hypothetical protein
MSQLEVDKVIPQSGTTLTLGDSADTITIPSGATLDASSATLTLPDGSVTAAKLASTAVDNTNTNSTVITGQTAETSIDGADSILIYDDSATALRKMTRTNFVAGIGGTNTPAFSVTRTSSQTLTTGVTTKIQGDIELLDTDGDYDNVTNYRFTPTTSGFYQFNLCCQPSRTNSNTVEALSIYIYKNGSVALLNAFSVDSAVENVFGYSISGVLEANGTTDYFEAFINFSVATGTPSIGTANGTANFNFSGFKIIQ